MANRKNTFLIKRSNTPGKIPTAGDLLLGELALNTADVILYASGTTSNSILPIGWDRVARTGDTMTGPLYGTIISAATISATTLSSSTLTVSGVTFNKLLVEKVGLAAGTGFTGNPKKFTVSFGANFSNTNYAIIITGPANRTYTYESQTTSGFTINANANGAFTGNVYWIAKQIGEV